MTTRLIVAYGLIALMVVFAGVVALWRRYNSFAKRDARQRQQDDARYERRVSARKRAEP